MVSGKTNHCGGGEQPNDFYPYVFLYYIVIQVSGDPTKEQTEEITSLWQTGLRNNHILADRFLLEPNRAIFMFKVS